jgi:predicted AAA+ superfamily ATPase
MPRKNQEEYNRRRRERYKNDPEYRKKVLERCKKTEQYQKVKEYRKKYAKTPNRIKMSRIRAWKNMGVKHSIDYLKNYYDNKYIKIKNCESCNNSFDNCRRVLDHCHLSGSIRNTICNKCNCIRSSIDTKRYILLLELHRYFN